MNISKFSRKIAFVIAIITLISTLQITAAADLPPGIDLPAGNGVFLAAVDSVPPPEAVAVSDEAQLRAIPSGATGYFYLTQDIYLTEAWTPIVNFGGTFDGRGHSINNLSAPDNITATAWGLFGNIFAEETIIKNLGVNIGESNVLLLGRNSHVGGIVGSVSGSLVIDNSFVTGDIISTRSIGNHFVGGLVGNVIATGFLEISNSYTTGNITSTFYPPSTANNSIAAAGGLVGAVANSAVIDASYSLGNIHAGNGVSSSAAGLAGRMFSTQVTARLSAHGVFSAGNITAYNAPTASDTAVGGDLVGVAPSANHQITIDGGYHLSSQMIDAGRRIILGEPTDTFTTDDLRNWARLALGEIPIVTYVGNINVSGALRAGIPIEELGTDSVTVHLNGAPYGTVSLNRDGSFVTTVTLVQEGENSIHVTADVGERHISSHTAIIHYYPGGLDILRFTAVSGNSNPINLLRNDGLLDILLQMRNRPITFSLEIGSPEGQIISNVNIIANTGERLEMVPLNGRWIYTDFDPLPIRYIRNRIEIEIVRTTPQINTDQILRDRIPGITIDPRRYRDSFIMPTSRGATTNAYLLNPNLEPNSDAIGPNSGTITLAPGLSLRTGGGNEYWTLIADSRMIGRTAAFWAHANVHSEVIFASFNEAGEFPIGFNSGMNGFYFYGAFDGYGIVRQVIAEGRFRLIIDPSGNVFEAVPSNRLEGVTATVFEYVNGSPLKWNAEEYEQENPLITDSTGFYRWDVPPGWWRVRYEKDGFETLESILMQVPPEHLDVHVGLVSRAAPQVERVTGYPSGIEIVFSRYMREEYLTTENFTLTQNGREISGQIRLINRESNFLAKDYMRGTLQPSGFPGPTESWSYFASVVRFVPDVSEGNLSGEMRLTICGTAASYADVALGADVIRTVNIVPEPRNVSANNLRLGYGESGTITVTALPVSATANRAVTVTSANPTIAALHDSRAAEGGGLYTFTLDADGRAEIPVQALLPGITTITVRLDGTLLAAQAAVAVGMPLDIREEILLLPEVAEWLEDKNIVLPNLNAAPEITSANSYTVTHGTAAEFQVTASGIPAAIFFNVSGEPEGVSISPAGMLNIAAAAAPGTHSFTVTASNGTLPDYRQTFTLTVEERKPPPSPILLGDVNGDGHVNIADLTALRLYLAGSGIEINRANADVDGENGVDAGDVGLLRRYLAGVVPTL